MLTDTDLRAAVQEELDWEPGVTAAHIGVTARDGVVTLTGHVNSYAGKHAAELAAGRVKGVQAVAEEIEIRFPYDPTTSDGAIAAAVLERLAWNAAIPPNAVKVHVEQGWVTLSGEVNNWFQRDAAEQDVRPLKGITGVTDHITLNANVDTTYLSDTIEHALHRSWFFDPKEVTVTAEGGHIRLTGSVHSTYERSLAETTAWAAPGALSINNEIIVAPRRKN
jgi:osmotically-inducible protein OsmY